MMRSSPLIADCFYPKRVIRYEPFPLMVLKMYALARQRHHASKMGIYKEDWYQRLLKRWSTVQLVKTSRGWYLTYEGKVGAGPYATKAKAVDYYLKGGR